ncbi:hypothetical protein ABZ461_39395 [Actinacidiphila glaucinigra]
MTKAFGASEEHLAAIAEQFGVDVQDLEFREPPGMWEVPRH